MASKTISIAFSHGGILPADVMKSKKDIQVPPRQAVDVPAEYGQYLIDNKYAFDPADLPSASSEDQSQPTSAQIDAVTKDLQARADDLQRREAALSKAQSQLQLDQSALTSKQQEAAVAQKAADDRAKALASAQAAIVDARAKLAAADDAGKPAAQDILMPLPRLRADQSWTGIRR
jgi:hypothetical protein